MDYGSLIRQAWRFTWRFKFLWVLGLFAPSTVGSCSPSSPGGGTSTQWRADEGDLENLPPELSWGLMEIGNWVMRNIDLIMLIALLAFLIGLAFFIVSIIAQGAMARGTADVALGRETSLGRAWEVGVQLFWRYLLLFLVLIGLAILIAIAIGLIVALAVLIGSLLQGNAQVIFIILSVLAGIAFSLVAIVLFIAVGVAVAFAQRAIAIEDVGPVHAIRIGARLILEHLGTTLLVWLISLGLSIAASIIVGLAAILLALPLGGLAAILFVTLGASAVSVIYTVIAGLLFIAGVWFLGAIANTYFWHYWTMTYLNFTGRLTDRMEIQEV